MKKRLFGSILIIAVLVGVLFTLWYRSINSTVFMSRPKTTAVKPPDTIAQHLSDKTPFDILLLGYGGGTHDGPYLTDTMMDIHVDPTTQKIFLLSIPRDLWVNITPSSSSASFAKINAAYAQGEGQLAQQVTARVTGLPVDYFVGVDFSGFIKTIDTLGGVDINVQPAFDDPGYPDEASTASTCNHSADDIKAFTATVSAETDIWAYFSCRYTPVHFDAGLQHMSGARALVYARSRHSPQDGSDFSRATRQQKLLVAVEQKIFSIGFITKIVPFVNSLKNDVHTDLALSDIQAMLTHAPALKNYQIISLALTDQNYLQESFSSDHQDILIPKDGQDTYTTIHTWITDVLSGKPEPKPAVVQVENGTNTPGIAQTATNTIAALNIQTLPSANAGIVLPKTIITTFGTIIPTDLALLKNQFSGINFSSQPATTSAYTVRIIVGEDYIKK